jgi:hypothetical protein
MSNIKLKVIADNKNLYYYIFRLLLSLLIAYWIIIFLLVFFIKSNLRPLFIIGLLGIVLLVFLSIIKPTFKILGNMILDHEYIFIDFLNKKYQIKELIDLQIEINGYRWQPQISRTLMTFSNGINNSISFLFNTDRYKFSILIKTRKEYKRILKFLQEYKIGELK